MLPHLVDLESRFDFNPFRPYDPVELIRYALGPSDYWADLAVGWLEDGVPPRTLVNELSTFEAQADRPQSLRHRAGTNRC
jgi:hypothetical protein